MRTALVLLAVSSAFAQLTSKGQFTPSGRSSMSTRSLPKFDNDYLASLDDGSHGGYQFGHVVDFPLRHSEDGHWSVLSNGDRTWSLTIQSPSALNLGVRFEDFYIPEGGELYVIGEETILGAYTSKNVYPNGVFQTWPLEGNTLTLEYFQPSEVLENPNFQIKSVTHGMKPLCYGCSGKCNINVVCDDQGWSNEIRSVGMLLSAAGSRFCSGALVNNVENDGTQYFLSANHCSVASSSQVMFNYQSASCENQSNGPTTNVVANLVPLVSNTYSDFDLIRIDESIPASWNVYLSGLSAVNTAATQVCGIHHPSGDIKKITYAYKSVTPDKWSVAEPGNWHWRISSWDEGTTEPGSSGSPLFDQNRRVIGQLHGGAASCANNSYDSYGACWASWTNGMSTYLDPNSTGTLLINGTDLNALRRF